MIKLPENFLRIFARTLISALFLVMLIFFGSRFYNSKCLITIHCEPIYFLNLIPKFNKIYFDEVKIKVDIKVVDRYQYLDLTSDETSFIVTGEELKSVVFKVKNNDKKLTERYKLKPIVDDNRNDHIVIYNCCNGARKIKPNEEQVNKLIFKFDKKILQSLYYSSLNRDNQKYIIYYELIKI